jgi:exopolysaccharide production protein ExoZ
VGKLNNLQALRAFAALCVVFLHVQFPFPWFPTFGHRGVDIFFVLSGFVMAALCSRETVGTFAKRRLVRILPLYWSATIVYYLLAQHFHSAMRNAETLNAAMLAKSLLFIPFYRPATGYEPVLGVGWTLNYEMFFYAVLALSLALYRKRATLVASTIIIGVLSACKLLHATNSLAFYSNSIVLEFLAGILCYEAYKRVTLPRLYAGAGVCLSLPMLFLPQVPAAVPSTILVLSCVLLSKIGLDMRARAVILAGDASYVLYVIHSPIVGMTMRMPWLHVSTYLPALFLFMAVMVSISVFLHLRFEKPVVRLLNSASFDFMRERVPVVTAEAHV